MCVVYLSLTLTLDTALFSDATEKIMCYHLRDCDIIDSREV